MVVKNWIRAAAEEIAAKADGYSVTGREVQTLIEKYCPFEPDVAYMPVPRCETCKHWIRGTIPVIKQPSHGGSCMNPELHAYAEGWQTLETSETFGCVQWEKK